MCLPNDVKCRHKPLKVFESGDQIELMNRGAFFATGSRGIPLKFLEILCAKLGHSGVKLHFVLIPNEVEFLTQTGCSQMVI